MRLGQAYIMAFSELTVVRPKCLAEKRNDVDYLVENKGFLKKLQLRLTYYFPTLCQRRATLPI